MESFADALFLGTLSGRCLHCWLAKHGKELKPAVYEFPSELDKETAFAKLETMGIKIDKWTKEQATYAKAYAEGT